MAVKGVRYMFAIMLCIANMIIYGLKVNVTVTQIGMKYHYVNGTKVEALPGETRYDWSETESQGLSSFYFAGYMSGMFVCGYFADRFNTKWVLLFCVFTNSILTLIVPIIAAHLNVLLAVRFIMGLVSAANLPIVNVFIGKWVVFEEKSLWVAIIYSGTSLGTVISIFTSGWIMDEINWETVFYVHGILPLIWCAVFMLFFSDTPEEQKFMTEEERNLLINTYGHRSPGASTTKKNVPWKAIFTSVPFWALIFTNTLGNFTWYFLLTLMPTYMATILKFKIKTNVGLTCLPYLLSTFFNPVMGKLLDSGRKKGWWSQNALRKIAVTLSCIPAIIFMSVSLTQTDKYVVYGLMAASIMTSGMIFIGHLTNQNDLAPNYAGILMGITNTPGTISAFVNPVLIGVLTDGISDMDVLRTRWIWAFLVQISCQIGAWVIFMLFGSGEVQPWNNVDGAPAK